MEKHELIRRAEDLASRCERSGQVTHTGFLSPAERYELASWAKRLPAIRLLFHGGGAECERTAAFFLPDWMEEESFAPEDYLRAMEITAHFGTPGHRDYMGALLGMGIGREWLGDIRVTENRATVFCMPSVLRHLLSLDKVGRFGVSTRELSLDQVPVPVRKGKEKSFSVQSMRLDAVAAGLFDLSRSEAARQIEAGLLTVNYRECLKVDLPVREGDVISLKGKGKAEISGTGGTSRKGRLFVYGKVYL